MRVLSVVNWLNRGGIEVQLLQALPWLKTHGIEMDICATGPGSLDSRYEALGCKIWFIPKTANCLATARHFQRILAQGRYDCVHSNLDHVSGGYALGAARAGVPIAVSFHSAMSLSLHAWRNKLVLAQVRKLWLSWHRRLMEKHARIFVGHSETNIRGYSPQWKTQPARYRTILNGVDFPASLPARGQARSAIGLDDDALAIIHVGSFKAVKNHAGLLQILRHVAARRPRTVLLLVGDGPLRPAIVRRVAEMGLTPHVRFEGVSTDVWKYYAAADVVVFPSEMEGFGNALVEAQGCGVPVVASDIPGHRESVAPSQRGFLFPLPQYEQATELVLEQAEAARRLDNPWVETARSHVRQHFGIDRFAADLQQLYLDLKAA